MGDHDSDHDSDHAGRHDDGHGGGDCGYSVEAPPVLFETCTAFTIDADDGSAVPVCSRCGWMADEHRVPAEVAALPLRPRSRRPARRAS